MRPKSLARVKKGDRLTVARWNEMVDALNRAQLSAGQDSGLDVQITPFGTMVRVVQSTRFLAVANGAITKRSGTTAGTGSVYLVTLNGTTLVTSSVAYSVNNPSSNAMTSGNGIDNGQYCWVEADPAGNLIVTPVECS